MDKVDSEARHGKEVEKRCVRPLLQHQPLVSVDSDSAKGADSRPLLGEGDNFALY